MSNKKLITIILGIAFVATLILSSLCFSIFFLFDSLGQSETAKESTIFLTGGQPKTLDPALTHGGPGGLPGYLFSGLVTLDPDMTVQPDLAIGWDISEDGTIYTFYLHPEAKFHNGRSISSEDFLRSWERAVNPDTGSDTALTYLNDIVGVTEFAAGEAETISGVTLIDKHTLQLTIDAPKAYFLSKLVMPVSFVIDPNTVDLPDWDKNPNGSGPFQLQIWEDDELLILRRFDSYVKPAHITHIRYDLGPNLSLSLYEKGEIDLVYIGGSNLERMQDPNNPLSSQLQTTVDLCTRMVGLDTTRPPFDNPKVRQAFSYAIDRNQLTNSLFHNHSLPAYGPLPPSMAGFSHPTLSFDPEIANRLLDEAGYADRSQFPQTIYLSSGYGDTSSYVAALITSWEQNLGIKIESELTDPYEYLDELYAGHTGNLYNYSWCADYLDPQNFLDILYHSNSTQNLGRYQNKQVDQLLEKARVEKDINKRITLYKEIEQLIISDAPSIYIAHSLSSLLLNPRIEGYQLTPISTRIWDKVTILSNK